MIENKIKLVIWDLDDTFWQGTLTEGGIVPVDRNKEIVLELSRRGIVNSICSKNDYEQVKATLSEHRIWEYFVFPHIQFSPKGKAVAEMLENAGLRAENTLFIDDNLSNLEEVKFFNPGIMTAHPTDILDALLDHPHCAGKPDPELTRLKQYQFLQRRAEERSISELSNEEFLRASNIRVRIDYDVASNLERVVDLINRTNQLNYTKRRLSTPEDIQAFRESLSAFGFHAGCVFAVDNFGDYGLIGFFQMRRKAMDQRLIHFVFSCRTMNMGVEQYVYQQLGQPRLDVVEPVSYHLQENAQTDWINSDGVATDAVLSASSRTLVLLGGCDLLQLASYCSTRRVEFVNRAEEDAKVRYDDPGFVLAEREAIRRCEAIKKIACWNYDDAIRFDRSLAEAEVVIVSLWPGNNGEYYRLDGGLRIRLGKVQSRRIRKSDPEWFSRNFEAVPLSLRERRGLITQSFEAIGASTPQGCLTFLLGCCTHGVLNSSQRRRRRRYNVTAREFCEAHPEQFRYVDIDALVPAESLVDKVHFTREVYFMLARHIMGSLTNDEATAPSVGETLQFELAQAAE